MTCEAVRDALLEADASMLSGSGDDELSVHLRGCVGCGRIAEKLLEAQQEMVASEVFARATTPPPVFVDGVLAGAAADDPSDRRSPRRLARRVGIPTLAAAAVAALLLWSDSGPPVPAALPQAAASVPPEPRIEPGPGRSVAVMKTGNPSITVVWLLEGGGR